MDLRNRRALKQDAAAALGQAPNEKKIIAVYIGASLLVSTIVVLANLLLDNRIDGTSGLDSMGSRTILQTIQMVLMLGQFLALMVWEYGYLGTVLKITRRQNADHRTLLDGFPVFWPVLRLTIIQYGLLFLLTFASVYLGTMVFTVTPFVNPLVDAMLPLLERAAAPAEIMADPAVVEAANNMLLPLLGVVLAVYALLALPIQYLFRLAGYCLLDNPRAGALRAMGESRRLMRRNRLNLLKLDLSFWWYFLLDLIAMGVCYADQWLPLLGITLPFSEDAGYLLTYGLYLPIHFAINYYFRNRLEVTYAKAYEALKPKPQEGGIVLGNIFQM